MVRKPNLILNKNKIALSHFFLWQKQQKQEPLEKKFSYVSETTINFMKVSCYLIQIYQIKKKSVIYFGIQQQQQQK